MEVFYEDVLSKAIEENKARYTIVMGDFNAKVGERQPEEEAIPGKFSYGLRNRRGDMILEFAAQHKLIVANSLFKKTEDRYWTREAPMEIQRIKIEYILTSQRGIIQNCEVITKVDMGSDHRMVRAKIHVSKKKTLQTKIY